VKLSAFLKAGTAAATVVFAASAGFAEDFNIPSGDLKGALETYTRQTGVSLVVSGEAIKGVRTRGVRGDFSTDDALVHLLSGTGFTVNRHTASAITIVPDMRSGDVQPLELAQAVAVPRAVETVTVTSSKLGGADVQSIPIAITALSQEQLTSSQTNGGPDLIKQVPNMTFTKTNFSGYSIQIRGIGTQAISVTTDPAVAVSMNDIPFIRNHFFEQEFYDVGQVEVLRGPQGTLYGRNATAGVVNLTTAKPSDQFEAMASGEIGNYHQRRFEGMINLPIVDDRLDIRFAGEWTKRQGYSFNEYTDNRIDGRDLWSGRLTIGLKPAENLQMYLVWEHFSEDDDRIRSSKQLCKTDYGPGYQGPPDGTNGTVTIGNVVQGLGLSAIAYIGNSFLQGCKPTSLYSPDAFETPLSASLPYITGLGAAIGGFNGYPYSQVPQSSNLRVIQSTIDPIYKAKNDVVELNSEYAISPALTFTSQTGFSHDFLYSAEDYTRFGSNSGFFQGGASDGPQGSQVFSADGVFCDPQLGCASRVIVEDLSQEHAWQLSQEFRLASNFSGPLNFSVGGNYLHYETQENYYVFSNTFTLITLSDLGNFANGFSATNPWIPGVSDNALAFRYFGLQYYNPNMPVRLASGYIDPNPLDHLNDNGHNYFLSKNPYVLNSYAAFGEVNYNILDDLKLVAGLRWTQDQKHFPLIPSWLVTSGWGYPVMGVVDQQWDQFTGRAVANWTPKLAFTDQTLIYGSYSHGYKAGGANPPGALFSQSPDLEPGISAQPVHPLTFKPEFVDAFELGTKNTLFDGAVTLNGSLFYYNYENYQISEIVDRTAINRNFDAHVTGAELEGTWEPLPGLRFNFSGGWEDARIAKGQSAVDLMDRTAGHSDWYVVKPFVNEASNCIFPTYVAERLKILPGFISEQAQASSYCAYAYNLHADPLTGLPYTPNPTDTLWLGANSQTDSTYIGFDPSTAPNNGAGFSKNVGGSNLPNSPPFTASLGAQYTMPLSADWAGTVRADGYYQDSSWWRVFNDLTYDKLHGYATMNLTLILTNQAGWQVMLYDKNVFNTTAITGAFLNSDDSGLTTNVFLTDPKLIGIRVTKNW
jgi:outer membrane receptor protein involved in Fe transport